MFKKGVVIKANKIKPLKLDYETIILFSLFLCGVILGVFLIKNCDDEIKGALSTLLSNYISAKSECGFFACFSGILIFLLLFLFATFIFGLCAVGTPLVWLVPIVFGIICSGFVSLMLVNYGLKGILYCIMVDLLPYAITTATLVKCCCESTKISVNLFCCISGDNISGRKNLFLDYVLNYLILCIPIVIGALISGFLFKILQGLFIFAWVEVFIKKNRSFGCFNGA